MKVTSSRTADQPHAASQLRESQPGTSSGIVILGTCCLLYILAPPLALVGRVPWLELPSLLKNDTVQSLLRLSLGAAVLSTACALVLGTSLALLLSTLSKGRFILRALVYLPLALPPVVAGMALTALFGRRGLFGPLLDSLHVPLAYSFSGVVAAHTFIVLPFVVVSVDIAVRSVGKEVFDSSRSLGMSQRTILRKITLPLLFPSIASGAGIAMARSLGEFGTTITFAGSMPDWTRTMPLGIYLEREIDPARAYAFAGLLLVLSIAALMVVALPFFLRRRRTPCIVDFQPLDTKRLSELTAPSTLPTIGSELATIEHVGTSWTVHADDIVAVLGSNGSGKTTLLKLLAGQLTSPDTRVTITASSGESLNLRPVLLTQRPCLPPHTTVSGAIDMVTGSSDRTQHLLDASGLSALANVPVPALSGGQAAQVALVRALATRPTLLLLDEPLAAADVAAQAQWRAFLSATAHQRGTVLVTHSLDDVMALANRALVVESGRIIGVTHIEDLLRTPPNHFSAALVQVNAISDPQLVDAALAQGWRARPPQSTKQGEPTQVFIPYSNVHLHAKAERDTANSTSQVAPTITGVVVSRTVVSRNIAHITVQLNNQHIVAAVPTTQAMTPECELGSLVAITIAPQKQTLAE